MKKDVIVIDSDIFVYCNPQDIDPLFRTLRNPGTEVWIAQRDSLWGATIEERINSLVGENEKVKRKPIYDIFKERKKEKGFTTSIDIANENGRESSVTLKIFAKSLKVLKYRRVTEN